MPMTIDELYTEANALSNKSKAILADRLVKNIGSNIAPVVEKSHLKEIKRRRDDIRLGVIFPVPGEQGLAQVRSILE